MQFDFTLPGPGSPALQLTRSWWTGRTTLRLNGAEVPALPAESFLKRSNKTYLIPLEGGSERRLVLISKFYDPVPDAYVDGQELLLAKKLEPWEYMVACLPLMLVFAGGLVGGLLGTGATLININIMRSTRPVAVRVGMCLGVGALAFAVVALLAGVLYAALNA